MILVKYIFIQTIAKFYFVSFTFRHLFSRAIIVKRHVQTIKKGIATNI
jgi:hypothetical protein